MSRHIDTTCTLPFKSDTLEMSPSGELSLTIGDTSEVKFTLERSGVMYKVVHENASSGIIRTLQRRDTALLSSNNKERLSYLASVNDALKRTLPVCVSEFLGFTIKLYMDHDIFPSIRVTRIFDQMESSSGGEFCLKEAFYTPNPSSDASYLLTTAHHRVPLSSPATLPDDPNTLYCPCGCCTVGAVFALQTLIPQLHTSILRAFREVEAWIEQEATKRFFSMNAAHPEITANVARRQVFVETCPVSLTASPHAESCNSWTSLTAAVLAGEPLHTEFLP